jgi:AMIN domain
VAVIPAITQLDGPPRLVIDLLGAVDASTHQIAGRGEIKAVHVSQSDDSPPLTRITVDLTAPRSYVWEVVDNRLLVHLRPVKELPAAPKEIAKPAPVVPATPAGNPGATNATPPPATSSPAVPVPLPAAVPPPSPVASRGVPLAGVDPNTPTGGVVLMAGKSLVGNSAVTAGPETAILNLARGGQLHVCPGTTVSVTSSKTGRDLMLGMSTGALEAHYPLSAASDSILTPDFRILLQGPGVFHYAVSADTQGNTCVRSLQGNTGPAVIAELMGNGMYLLKPGQQAVFHGGQLAQVDNNVPIDCGCPRVQAPVMRAEGGQTPMQPMPMETASVQQPIAEPVNAAVRQGMVGGSATASEQSMPANLPMTTAEAAPAPPSQPNQVRVQVEAPLVYRAKDAAAAAGKGGGSQSGEAAANGSDQRPTIVLDKPQIAKPRRGFFGRMKHFLANVFG